MIPSPACKECARLNKEAERILSFFLKNLAVQWQDKQVMG